MDQGSGFIRGAFKAAKKAAAGRVLGLAAWRSRCAQARQAEVVSIMSTSMVQMMGPAAPGPSRATRSGTPMKPELGKAATSAEKAASRGPAPEARPRTSARPSTTAAQAMYRPLITGSSNAARGVFMQKRSSMQGRAKNSTKVFRPGIAAKGSQPRWAAT